MISLKQVMSASGVAMFMGMAAMAVTASPASAYVTCNSDGDCWHTDARPRAPGIKFNSHPDDWYFHQKWQDNKDYHYRDYHEGRGYYRGGLWITL